MPSTSKKQHNFMAAVANNPKFAKKVGVSQQVGKEFTAADKGLKFGKGTRTRADLQKVNRSETDQGKAELFGNGGDMKATKKPMPAFLMKKGEGKKPAKYASGGVTRADGIAKKGHTKGKEVTMKKGGMC